MKNTAENDMINSLFEAILSLGSVEECVAFFKDICTDKEIEAIAQRLKVAKMLAEKRTYTEIVTETGASTATISRVNRTLNDSTYGLASVIVRITKQAEYSDLRPERS